MKHKITIVLLMVVIVGGASVAGIPEPDMIFYGTVDIGGVPVTAFDDHAIIARIWGTSTTVGLYNMGDNTNAQDNYVLRVKLEDLANGDPQSDNYALIGQYIDIYVRQPNSQEHYAATTPITGRGEILELNLSASEQIIYTTDIDGSGTTNLVDFAIFAAQWLQPVCDGTNNNCEGANINGLNGVDIEDLIILAENWLD